MRSFGKWLGRVILTLTLVLTALFWFGPREPVDLVPHFDAENLPSDLDAYLAAYESAFPDIVPGTQKRIVWADSPQRRTPISIVYIHGFSATSEEIRPVPDRVAAALGANLFFTRLSGHGRGSAAMAEPTVQDWVNDMAEALAIGERIGNRVFVIATSTGGTLAAIAANDPELGPKMSGIIFVSPNFGLRSRAARILHWPLVRYWGPKIAGEEQSFEPVNADHERFWTTRYPTVAVFPMAALVDAAVKADYTGTPTPALFLYSEDDKVVSPAATKDIAGQWGGPMLIEARELGAGDDPYNHILAGDILSPGQTDDMVARILAWIRSRK